MVRRQPRVGAGPRWLAATALTVALAVGLVTGVPRRGGEAADRWTWLVQAGDDLAAGYLTVTLAGRGLTAAKAYLLAFHEAQDAGDLEHVLAVGDRLELAGQADLARHVRRAAETLLAEVSR